MSKFLQVGIIVIDGSDQTVPKYPKYFYCDTKHSDIIRESSHDRHLFLHSLCFSLCRFVFSTRTSNFAKIALTRKKFL